MLVTIKSEAHANCHIKGTLLSPINSKIGDEVEVCTFFGSKGRVILKAKGILIEKHRFQSQGTSISDDEG